MNVDAARWPLRRRYWPPLGTRVGFTRPSEPSSYLRPIAGLPQEIDRLDAAFAGAYPIVAELAGGGMARVFLADDLRPATPRRSSDALAGSRG